MRDLPLPTNLPDNLLSDLKLVPDPRNAFVFLLNQDFLTQNPDLTLDKVLSAAGAFAKWSTTDWSYEISSVPDGEYSVLALVDLALLRQGGSPPAANVQGLFRGIIRPEFALPAESQAITTVKSSELDPVVELLFPTGQSLEVVDDSFQGAGKDVNVPLETTASVTFSGQPAHSGNSIDVDMQIFPEPLSGQLHPGSLRRIGNMVLAKVRLQPKTTYRLILLRAGGQTLPPLRAPYKRAFTTGDRLGAGVVSGRLLPPPGIDFDAQVSRGFVGLLRADIDLKRLTLADLPRFSAAADLILGSPFRIENILPGSYIPIAVVDMADYRPAPSEDGLAQTTGPGGSPAPPNVVVGFLDRNANGELGPDDAVEIKEGDTALEGFKIQTGFESFIRQAPRGLTVSATTPTNGETNVEIETQVSVTFSEPLAATKRFVPVELDINPKPVKFDPKKLKVTDASRTCTIPVVFAEDETYILTIRDAVGASGAKLLFPVEVIFSTGAIEEELASVAGTVTLSDGSTPLGTVSLIDAGAIKAATKAAEVRTKAEITPAG